MIFALRFQGLVFGCILLATGIWSDRVFAEDDWPTYMHDIARSGVTEESLQLPLKEVWIYRADHEPQPAWPAPAKRDYWHHLRSLRPVVTYDRAFHTTAVGDAVYFGSSADDKVYCLDRETGQERWSFFTEGPVRLAPTIDNGKVYFGSDDGWAYCLNATNGSPVWKHRSPFEDRRLPGNGRVISLRAVRSGVLVENNTAYFFTGIFPTHKLHACALNAADGSVIWENEIGNISPQGYLLASANRLFAPTGRTTPAIFERDNGKYVGAFEGQGGSYALLTGDTLVSGPGIKSGEIAVSDPETHEKIASFDGLSMVVKGGKAYLLFEHEIAALNRTRHLELSREKNVLDKEREQLEKQLKKGRRGAANPDLDEQKKRLETIRTETSKILRAMQDCFLWRKKCTFPYSMILAGDCLFAGGDDMVVALDPETGKELWTSAVVGRAHGLAVARGRLYVSTDKGLIYSYGQNSPVRRGVLSKPLDQEPYPKDEFTPIYTKAAETILRDSGIQKGYCLILGGEEGRLAYELTKRSELQIVCIEEDAQKVEAARRKLSQAGLYGVRISIQNAALETLPYVDYFANLIVSDSAIINGILPGNAGEVLRVLRPEGGVVCLGSPENAKIGLQRAVAEKWITDTPGEDWKIKENGGCWAVLRRKALPGVGEWKQLYADAGNTACSNDPLQGPLGIQWYGRPGPRQIIDRHHRPMSPLYSQGRLFVNGDDCVIAADAYNGTIFWEAEVPFSRRIGALKDCGQTIVTDDFLYIAADEYCQGLKVETGEKTLTLKAPQLYDSEKRDWGYLCAVDDALYGSCTKPGASFYELSEGTCDMLEGDFRDMILCDYVFCMDRHSGETRWTYQSGVMFNNTIAIGDGRMYCVESRNQEAVNDPDGRISADRFCKSDTYLIALDLQSGQKLWEQPFQFPYEHIMYLCYADGTVLATGSYNQGDHVHYGLHAFAADSGKPKWENSYQGQQTGGTHGEQWQHPVIVGNTIYLRPYDFNLQTGNKGTYLLDRGGHGCGGLSGSAHYLYGRGNNPRMYALHQGKESGEALTRVNRPGCWINMLPAGGLLLLPESSSGCTCAYPMQLSIAFAPQRP